MASLTIHVNGEDRTVDAAPDTPLLWALRNHLGLTGTKFGCGMSLCGECTVHLDGEATRSCITPLSAAVGREITTIEGLSQDGEPHPLQKAWVEAMAPQCGYCQSGQIMTAASLLASNPTPTDGQIREAMSGNLCRCGTYNRIVAAVKMASGQSEGA
jgi:isoquinoline 1-oxidoreductase alpha subunit